MKGYSGNYYRAKIGNSGFTLVELLSAAVLIGIVTAVTAPNVIGMIRSQKVSGSMGSINGAIRETQKQAIRKGERCTVNIDDVNNLITGDCLLNEREINEHVDIRTTLPGNPPKISFSSKGNTTNGGTIVVSSDASEFQRCFVIAQGLGIMRTGKYAGKKTEPVDPNKCLSELPSS